MDMWITWYNENRHLEGNKMRKQNCCEAARHVAASASKKPKISMVKTGKRVLHVLVVLGVVAYTFFSRVPVDAYFR